MKVRVSEKTVSECKLLFKRHPVDETVNSSGITNVFTMPTHDHMITWSQSRNQRLGSMRSCMSHGCQCIDMCDMPGASCTENTVNQ